MSQEMAEMYAEHVKHLAWKARSTVRDLNPQVNHSLSLRAVCCLYVHERARVCVSVKALFALVGAYTDGCVLMSVCGASWFVLGAQNELRYFRIRAKKHEIMVAFGAFGRGATSLSSSAVCCSCSLLCVSVCAADTEFLVIVIQQWTPAGSA